MSSASVADHDDFEQVVTRVGNAKTSFYIAMRLLPLARRNAMFAVYAFCRDVDDIADEPAPQDEKHRALDLWRRDLDAIYADRRPTQALARALIGPIRDYNLRKADFFAMIDGMQTDADHVVVAPTLEELDLYCSRVASAVGNLSVRIFGEFHPRADDVADHLGKALQLTNILRDIDEDAERGRLYLPRELLLKHGVSISDVAAAVINPAIDRVCAEIAEMAEARFSMAAAAMRDCPRAAMRPARMMAGVYHVLLRRLIARGWTPPRAGVKLSKLTKILVAVRALIA